MEKKITLRKPKWLRRISSAFLDLAITFIIALLLSFASKPLCNLWLNGDEARQTYNEIATSTKLCKLDADGNIIWINDERTYDENLTYFYLNCTDNKIDEYIEKKKNNPELFYLDEEKNEYVEYPYDYYDSEIRVKYTLFYNEIRNYCIENYLDKYLNSVDEFKEARATLAKIEYLSLLLCATVSMLLVYLLVPMFNKEYKTIGKMAFRLKVVSKMDISLLPSRLQIIFRQLVLILFELVLSISTLGMFGIPIPIIMIISILMFIFTKYNQSFHDFCTSTMVVDDYPYGSPADEGSKYELVFEIKEEAQWKK